MAAEDKSLGTAGLRLMPLLRIAQRLGAGDPEASMRAALRHAGYADSRPGLAAQEVRALLVAHPSLLDAWLAYSQSKQTADGWYVLPDAEIGQLSNPGSQRQFASIQEAVAEFIVRELDHHADLNQVP
jgi:hypothetical protein